MAEQPDDPAIDGSLSPTRPWGFWLGIAFVSLGAVAVGVALLSGGDSAEAPVARLIPSAALSSGSVVPSTAPVGPKGLGGEFVSGAGDRSPLAGFGEVALTITDDSGTSCEVCMLLAYDEAQRARGLMEVTDPELGGYDGMFFLYPEPTAGAFWMRNTPMPLSIAYFDEHGDLVSTADMAPCADDLDCPSYPAGGPFRGVVEVAQGKLGDVWIGPGSSVTVDSFTCPLSEGS